MKFGDIVSWTSQSRGYSKLKTGRIVAVLPPHVRPAKEKFPGLWKGAGPGFSRDHESYVVQVGNKLYWPRVAALRDTVSELIEG